MRLQSLKKWTAISVKDELKLESEKKRKVKIEFVCPTSTVVSIHTNDKKSQTLIEFPIIGQETVEFITEQSVKITTSAKCFYNTVDGADMSLGEMTSESFVKIVTRKERNHEMELMMFNANKNAEARYQQAMKEQQKQFQKLMKEQNALQRTKPVGESDLPTGDEAKQDQTSNTGGDGVDNPDNGDTDVKTDE